MKKKCDKNLGVMAIASDENYRWISNERFNGLFKISNGRVEFVGRFPEYSDHERVIHTLAVCKNGRVFFFPYYHHFVDVYNIEEKEFEVWDLQKEFNIIEYVPAGYIQTPTALYIIPKYKKMPVLQITDKKGVVIRTVDTNYDSYLSEEKDLLDEFIVVEERSWTVVHNTNRIISYDCSKNKCKIYEIDEGKSLQNLVYTGKDFWIWTTDGYLLNWDECSNIKRKINLSNVEKDMVKLFFFNDKIYMLPLKKLVLYVLDISNENIWSINLENRNTKLSFDYISKWRWFYRIEIYQSNLYIYPLGIEDIIEVNLETNKVNYIPLQANDEYVPWVESKENESVVEYFFRLEDLIDSLYC